MDGLLILSIETATGCGSIALTRGKRLLAEATAQPEITHSRRLLGTVQWVMEAGSADWADLDGVAVSLGPGSFTGLRIGMAAAKGLAMAAETALVGVSTLEAMALAGAGSSRRLMPVLDARKKEVYTALFEIDPEDGLPRRTTADEAIAPQVLAGRITEPTVLFGSGVEVYGELFRQNPAVRFLPGSLAHPRALYVGLLAETRLARGEILDPLTAAPTYVRASEAELNLARRQRTG